MKLTITLYFISYKILNELTLKPICRTRRWICKSEIQNLLGILHL